MRQLKTKLRSRRGASITFALLLFLVCAVISTVVIVAASTAGGRMSGMRETDERYYAATEAARKLQSIFEETQKTTVGAVVVSYSKSADTYTIADAVKFEKGTDSVNDLLAAASKAVVSNSLTGTATSLAALDTIKSEDEKYTGVITPKLNNGLLNFEISATGPSGGKNSGTYKLIIAFTPTLKMPDMGSATSATATVSWSLNSLSKGRAKPQS